MAGLNDPVLGRALSGADLVVPDGIGIVWALRGPGATSSKGSQGGFWLKPS